MSMVVLELLTDVLYNRLKLDKQQAIPQRDQCDITFLYQQLYFRFGAGALVQYHQHLYVWIVCLPNDLHIYPY
jgi:hypothetical protein